MNSSSNTSKNTSSKDDDDDVENIRDIEITACSGSSESALLLHQQQQQRQFCWSNLASSSSSSQLQIQSLDSTLACPCCGLRMPLHHDDQVTVNDLRGLPAGVKFDPTDVEILEHLEAKVRSDMTKIHPLIDRFIPTIKGDNGICYTHPEKLPGVSKDGQIRHFFHRPSKAYTTGTRKRRKVDSSTEEDPTTGGGETRWHKTGKTRPVLVNGVVKGFKKILVLYANYGRQRKPEKTNWVMHQYHLGEQDEEKDGELVVSKVFYQTQPRQCGGGITIRELPPPLQQRGDVDGSSTLVTYFHHQRPFISYHQHQQQQQHDHIHIPVVTTASRDTDHELIPHNISALQSSFISLDSACEHQQLCNQKN